MENYIGSSQTRDYIQFLSIHQVSTNLSKLQVFFTVTFGSYICKLYPKLDLNPIFFVLPSHYQLETNQQDLLDVCTLTMLGIILQMDKTLKTFSLFSQGIQSVLRSQCLYKDLQKTLQERMKEYVYVDDLYVVSSKLLLYIAFIFKCMLSHNCWILQSDLRLKS